jgi:hypothetical protein
MAGGTLFKREKGRWVEGKGPEISGTYHWNGMKFKCLKQPIKVLLNGELVNHGHQ